MASAVSGAAGAQTAAPDVGSNNQLFQDRAMLRSSETSKLIFWIRAMIGDCFPATPSSNRFAISSSGFWNPSSQRFCAILGLLFHSSTFLPLPGLHRLNVRFSSPSVSVNV